MHDSQPQLDIAALAKAAGVSSRTIRYYGELGIVHAEARGPGGRRLYGLDALERLSFISRLKKLGLTLEEIRELNSAFDRGQTATMLERLDGLLSTHLGGVEQRLSELEELQRELQDYRDRIRDKRANLTKRKSA